MIGVESIGVWIPLYRLNRKEIFESVGWIGKSFAPGERTVANFDEDAITMAVNAAMQCDYSGVDAVFFASTTMPYSERQNAAVIASALDLPSHVLTSDFSGSTKAVSSAIIAALNLIKSGGAKRVLVCASDCRMGKVGGYAEVAYGDAAAAVVIGEPKFATIDDYYSLSFDFMDSWRIDRDRFAKFWEDRWVKDEGYKRFIPEAIYNLLNQSGTKAGDVSAVGYPCLYIRDYARVCAPLGFSKEKLLDPLFETVGNTGNPHILLMLAVALSSLNTGSRLVLATYGSGSDAFMLTVTGNTSLSPLFNRKKSISYEKYLAFKEMVPVEKGIRGEEVATTAVSVLWRDRREILGLVGSRCKSCGVPQYPAQGICVACGSQDMEPYRFADKRGFIFSFTEDYLAYSANPPAMYGLVDFEGGGRFWFDFTDCEPGELKVGDPVRMSFRRKDFDTRRRIYNYFWKAVLEVK